MKSLFLLSIFAIVFAISSTASAKVFAAPADNQTRENAAETLFTPSTSNSTITTQSVSANHGEPLLLLLFGLAIFVGATTIKKRAISQ